MANYVAPTVSNVAAVLLNDTSFIHEAYFFYNRLGVNLAENKALIDEHRKLRSECDDVSRCKYSLFKTIIHQWALNQGERATINSLAEILKSMRHEIIADELLTKFPDASPITTPWPISNSDNGLITAYQRHFRDDEALPFVDEAIKIKTRGAVKIVDFIKDCMPGQPRLSIFISHLIRILDLPEVRNIPVAVVSINGKRRLGKSFLMSQVIKYLTFGDLPDDRWMDEGAEIGFKWRHTRDSVTYGVQMWHDPFIINVNEKKVAVILLDTQGLHDANAGVEENIMIFSLSAILSSVFIYNEQSIATEDSLQSIHNFLECAKFISADEKNPSNNARKLTDCEKMVLLLRDYDCDHEFSFGYHNGSSPSPNLYKYIFEKTKMHREARTTRCGIKKCFSDISVFAMPGFGSKRPDKFPLSNDWEPEFRNGVATFVKETFSGENLLASTKKIFGREVTGSEFRTFVIRWADNIKNANIRSQTIANMTMESYYINEIDTCVREYQKVMSDYVTYFEKGVPAETFNTFNEEIETEILDSFCGGKVFGDRQLFEDFKSGLMELIGKNSELFRQINEHNLHGERELAKTKMLNLLKDTAMGVGLLVGGAITGISMLVAKLRGL